MVIQRLLVGGEQHKELYVRTQGDIELKGGVFYLKKGATLTTDTYYNSCSIGKWFSYTTIKDMKLVLKLKGTLNIEIRQVQSENGEIQETILYIEKIASHELMIFEKRIPKKEGVIYYKIHALEEESMLYDAYYESTVDMVRDVTIALNICTYKREKYLLRNLELLKKNFLNNEESLIRNHLKVFIIDNGNTLECKELSERDISVCYNPNVGGAGGFTRGLIEILKKREELGITHTIFMDDDIEIEPEAIRRTYCLLRLLREEYATSFIAGAMLRLDKKNIQHENGALWNAGKCQFINRGLDLENFKNVVKNEQPCDRDYAAWWYCCIPASVISKDNLPIPVFIHEDDVEYSLRNAPNIISMNGIAISHPVAEHKRVSSNEYYNLRNLLIVNSKYCPQFGKKKLMKKMFTELMIALLRFRYKDMRLIYCALRDFCKGPEWLLQLDAVKYHKEIQQLGYQFEDVRKDIEDCKQTMIADISKLTCRNDVISYIRNNEKMYKLWIQVLSLNGWLLPAKKETYAYFMGVHPIDLYRVGEMILYDDASGQGIKVRRSFLQIFVFIWLYVKALLLIVFKYDRSKRLYRNNYSELHSIKYWESVLEL